MPTFVITHHHKPEECAIAFAAWKGFESPLRGRPALSSCANRTQRPAGRIHQIWWEVEAPDRATALGLLPAYVAERTEVTEARATPIP